MKRGDKVLFIVKSRIKEGEILNFIDGKYVVKVKRTLYRKKRSELAVKEEEWTK